MIDNVTKLVVKKRDGSFEPFSVEKIHRIVERACEGIAGVSVSDVEMKAQMNFYNEITTTDITNALIKSAADLISENAPNYQYVAANLLNYNLRKDVWGGDEPPHIYNHIKQMVDLGFYTVDLITNYTIDEWNVINTYIDHDRDFNFAYIGLKEYIEKYAVRDRSLKVTTPLETPQITYILIAALSRLDRTSLKDIKSLYNNISNWNLNLPTPIMAGLRTNEKNFSSCVMISVDDNLDSIISGSGAIVKYVSKKAGIGLDVSRIRPEGSSVGKSKSVKHTGLIPFLKMYESALKSTSQGGVRSGSLTCFFSIWHKEIENLLVLKNNKGVDDARVRKMDYGVQINDYFYNRLINKQNISLFSQKDVPGLYEAFFKDQKLFAELYEKYEADQSIHRKTVSAIDLFTQLMIERKETGRIYIFNVDNVNSQTPYKAMITQSNLCMEIAGPTIPLQHLYDECGEIYLCTLAAINLGKINSLDAELEKQCNDAVRALDNLLTYQDYMLPAAKNSTMKYRPLGVGVINLAYYLAKNNVTYQSIEGWQLMDDTMEAINYYLIKASIQLAKEKGVCLGFNETKWADGLLPIDYYKKTIDDIVPFNPKKDWEWLREQLKLYGIRNAVLSAMMPSESSSRISNATNGVEPIRSLVTTKINKSLIDKQVAPESIRLKNRYDMLWDMKSMDGIIKSMAIIGRLTTQAISTNLSYNPQHWPDGEIPLSILLKDLLKANHYSLKTLYYHNTRDGKEDELVETKLLDRTMSTVVESDVCESCTI